MKQSQATIPAACWRRNARQVVVVRRGAGSSRWRRSVVRIAVAETRTPSRRSSLAAAYALKLALTGETYAEKPEGWSRELVAGRLAVIYTAFLLFAAGPRFILVSFIIHAPATILFVMIRREQDRRLFSPAELFVLAVSIVGAIVGVVAVATGWISI